MFVDSIESTYSDLSFKVVKNVICFTIYDAIPSAIFL